MALRLLVLGLGCWIATADHAPARAGFAIEPVSEPLAGEVVRAELTMADRAHEWARLLERQALLERQLETSSVTLEAAEWRLRRLAADYLRLGREADGLDVTLTEQRADVSRRQQRLEALLTEIVQLSRRESSDPRRLAQLRAVAGSLARPFAAARAALDGSRTARAALEERRAEIERASVEVRQAMLDAEVLAERLADSVDANRRAATEATRRLESAATVVKTASLRLERAVAGRALAAAEMPSASVAPSAAAASVGRSTRVLVAPRALTAQARLVEPPTRPIAHYDLPKTAIPGVALGGSGRELGGGHVVPVSGAVVSRFGEGQKPPFDQGLTIEVEDRRLVRAPRDGRIVFADIYEGFGLLLIIDHGNEYHSLLSGLSRFVVHEGWAVRAGQMIGTLEPGAQSAGRLYIELRRRGVPVDPLTWFAAGQDKVRS